MVIRDVDIKKIRNKYELSQTDLAELIGVSLRTIQNYESGGKIPKSKYVIFHTLLDNPEKFFTDQFSERMNWSDKKEEQKEYNQQIAKKLKKVPYYDIDVTSSISSSFNDIIEEPSFYVDYQPFNDCTAIVNNYGDSMYPKYKNGEKLAVKQIQNFDVITWGETYLVITNSNANDLKTVKDVHPHEEEDKIILRASNPAYKGDTPVKKEDIIAMFAVKGKISQNFL